MPSYRVTVWIESGGTIDVNADTPEEAKQKALEQLGEHGASAIERVSHGDTMVWDVEPKEG